MFKDQAVRFGIMVIVLVYISKYRGKRMEHDIDFVCPVCSVHDSTEKTVNSTTMLGADPTQVNTLGLACAASPSTASVSNLNNSTTLHVGVPELPSFIGLSPPSFLWNDTIEGFDFVDRVTAANDEVVHWKRNLFVVPFGKVGKEFVLESSLGMRLLCSKN